MGKGGGGFLFALSSLSRSLEQATLPVKVLNKKKKEFDLKLKKLLLEILMTGNGYIGVLL